MSDTEHIEITIADLSRVELAPGDVLIFRHPRRISTASAEAIKKNLGEAFPGHRIGVLDDGADLAVIRPATVAATALIVSGPRVEFTCSVCLYDDVDWNALDEEQLATRHHLTVINGQMSCEYHAAIVGGREHSLALVAAKKHRMLS